MRMHSSSMAGFLSITLKSCSAFAVEEIIGGIVVGWIISHSHTSMLHVVGVLLDSTHKLTTAGIETA